MTTVAASVPSAAPKAAWVCLVIAWVCFIVPIPGIGLIIGWPLNFVAFILAIVAMATRGAMAGLLQLLASLIVSPVVYFIGLAVLFGGAGAIQRGIERGEANVEAAKVEVVSAKVKSAEEIKAEAEARVKAAAEANELLSTFEEERDDFNGLTKYYPKGMKGVSNHYGLYLILPDKGQPNVRFEVMYFSDDWLFIEGLGLSVDGERLPGEHYNWGEVKRDNHGGKVWEWLNEPVVNPGAAFQTFEKIANGKKVTLRFDGRDYYDDRTLTEREKQGMLKVMKAYRLLEKARS